MTPEEAGIEFDFQLALAVEWAAASGADSFFEIDEMIAGHLFRSLGETDRPTYIESRVAAFAE